MKKDELKLTIINFANDMIDEWFDGNTIQENLSRTVAKTVLKAQQNKYDNYIDLVTDENGNVLVEDLLNNFSFQPFEIDLTKWSYLLPRKILLFTENDYNRLKDILLKKG